MIRLVTLEVVATIVVGVVVFGALWLFEVWPMVPATPETATAQMIAGFALGALVGLVGIAVGLLIDDRLAR